MGLGLYMTKGLVFASHGRQSIDFPQGWKLTGYHIHRALQNAEVNTRRNEQTPIFHHKPCHIVQFFMHIMCTLMGFPSGSDAKESAYNAGDLGSIPGLGRSPGEGNGYPPQYSCLENPMDRGAWRATVHRVARVGYNWSSLARMHAHVLW